MNQSQMERSRMEHTFGGPFVVGRARKSASSSWLRWGREKHLWCSRCSRTFPNGIYRDADADKKCPYAGCEGDVAHDACEWSLIRRERPNYPAAPWPGVQYLLNTRAVTARNRKSWRSI